MIVIGSIVAYANQPFARLGVVVGMTDKYGPTALTVDQGEFGGFMSSRYSQPLLREVVEYDPDLASKLGIDLDTATDAMIAVALFAAGRMDEQRMLEIVECEQCDDCGRCRYCV